VLAQEYNTMRTVEDDYWWYSVLRGLVRYEVGRTAGDMQHPRILDAGCGTGGMLASLRSAFGGAELAAFDLSPLAVQHTRARGFRNVFKASVDHIPLGTASQDAVVSLDVLYHEGADQERAMQEFHRLLVPEGRLIMNLPAFECLRGRHDVAVKNVRRYTPRDVRELHQRHGFTIERLFCWNAWLFLPILLWRQLSRNTRGAPTPEAKSDLKQLTPVLNGLLGVLGGLEATLCRAARSPLGTSVFSVAVKKQIR
jgi:SAM-dependent methyltransferase